MARAIVLHEAADAEALEAYDWYAQRDVMAAGGFRSELRDTVLIEELGSCRGQVRADVALVNGSLHAYEITSDRDNLARLLPRRRCTTKSSIA